MKAQAPLAVVVKGYPRLSETFVAQELAGMEAEGLRFDIWSLRHPTDPAEHPIHAKITASRQYLPEYLHNAPLRVLRGLAAGVGDAAFWRAAKIWARDFLRDPTINRIRRFGQAAVLAHELPAQTRFLYVHFMHTPGSVARYAAIMRKLEWGFSAHAKDIWTLPEWEKREKLAACRFALTCTRFGAEHLRSLSPEPNRVRLVYHGLDLSRFPTAPERRAPRDGSGAPVRLLSVGRLVPKKGYGDLLDALALLPPTLNWRFIHIGGGKLKSQLKAQAEKLGVADKIEWRGAQAQEAVIEALRDADVFTLPSRVAEDGDRDGLPNVLMEAASQKLPIVSTRVSAIPEFLNTAQMALLTPPNDPQALAKALETAISTPDLRAGMGEAAHARLHADFGAQAGVDAVVEEINAALNKRPRRVTVVAEKCEEETH